MSFSLAEFFRKEKLVYTAPTKPIDLVAQWYYFVRNAQDIANDIALLLQFDFLEDEIIIQTREDDSIKEISIPIYSTLTSLLSLNEVQTGLGLNLMLSEGGRTSLLDVVLRSPPQTVARSGVLVLNTVLRVLETCKRDYDRLKKTKYTMPDVEFETAKKQIHLYAKRQVELVLAILNQIVMSVLSTRVMEISAKQALEPPPVPVSKGHE